MAAPALLFDLDGTLVDSACDIARALTAVSTARGGPIIDATTVRPLVSLGAATLVLTALGAVAGDCDTDLEEFRRVLANQPADRSTVYPGAEAALATLAQAGHPMAIVTNKPEGLSRGLLQGLGLDRYFGAIVGGDTAAYPKPDRAPIDHALALLGARADAAIFIGDSHVDAAAALVCAIPFILYQGGYGAADCREQDVAARFDRFEALPALLASTCRARAAASKRPGA